MTDDKKTVEDVEKDDEIQGTDETVEEKTTDAGDELPEDDDEEEKK